MTNFIYSLARLSALIGGFVLTMLALLMTISVMGGSIAKFAYWDFTVNHLPSVANMIQASGIRTVPAMYEIMTVGIAFVIFAFLPIAQIMRGHAVVDIFTSQLPYRPNLVLRAFWETVFFVVLVVITWRLFFGMERLIRSHEILVELNMPRYWFFALAIAQMCIASLVSFYVAFSDWVQVFGGKDQLPKSEGAAH